MAHGEARDRLASLADLFSGFVEQTEALVADWEARRTTS
ncbi:ArsR family transcriptional regulator OS=Streptomyces cyaneofuscatus OX=66883 GN=G3I52_30315 PE=4 SV=1 [Streptomyces cyaneofuscatus]